MVYNIIAILILLYSLVNYKKSFLIFLVYQMFYYESMPLFSFAGTEISISLVVMFCYFTLFFIKGNVVNKTKCRIPFAIPYFMIVLSYFLSCFTTYSTFLGELFGTLTFFSRELLTAWLIWYVIEDEIDYNHLFKYISIVIAFACICGWIEYLIESNIFIEIKNSVGSESTYIMTYDEIGGNVATSRGYRISSIFEHPTGAGMTFALYSSFIFYLYITDSKKFRTNKDHLFFLIVAIMCVPCILITKMRAAMLFWIIIMLSCIKPSKKKFYVFLFTVIAIIVICAPLFGKYLSMFLSIFDSTSNYSANGSSLEQRYSQYRAAYYLWNQSPLFGIGGNGRFKIINEYTIALLGYESVWLGEMVSRGIFGIVSYITFACYSILIIPIKYKQRYLFFLGAAYWVVYSLSSIPSFRYCLFYLIIFWFVKNSETYKNMRPRNLKFIKFILRK